MTLPVGTEWTETHVIMNGASVSYPILRAAVRTAVPGDEPEMVGSFYPVGPQDSFLLREVVIPNATGEDYDLLMDQIVTLINNFAQPFLDQGASTSIAKKHFRGPEILTELS